MITKITLILLLTLITSCATTVISTKLECQKMGGSFVDIGEEKGFCDNPRYPKGR